MWATKKTTNSREAFTLVEMLVVMAIILAIAALAAAFAPRVSENQNLTRAVDNLEQWLLTAKMRAKRDGLATGIRFIPQQGDLVDTNDPKQPTPRTYSQFQYIQQPDPLSGTPGGGTLVSAINGTVTFSGVDFSMGGAALAQGLVQTGDYLEVRDGGVYYIAAATGPTTLQLGGTAAYSSALSISTPSTNFRILRQPRILIGEDPLNLPNNFAVDTRIIPGPACATPPISQFAIIPGNWYPPPYPPAPSPPSPPTSYIYWSNVQAGASGNLEILFSPTGTVVGANASNGIISISLYDTTMNPFDINKVGIVGVQSRTGFIGAYSAALGSNPFAYVGTGRDSGL